MLALPPILTATAAGIHGADREAVHAARALGMSAGQIVRKVEWPLALPLVISGLRSATLQVVATATIAAYSSGDGLGRLLISRMQLVTTPKCLRVPSWSPCSLSFWTWFSGDQLARRASESSAQQTFAPRSPCSHNLFGSQEYRQRDGVT